MITGNPIKLILSFSIPVILGNLLQNAYNIADTVIVGRAVGVSALAAVGATGTIFGFFVMLIAGLMSGISIVAGIKYGAGKYEELKKVYINGLLLTLCLSTFITITGTVFVRQLLSFMNTPDDIIDDSCKYLFIIFCGMTSTMLYNFFAEMMRALGNSKRPFIYLMVACFVNIGLDILLISVFGMGVEGAAVATVTSQTISAILGGLYCHRSIGYFKIRLSDIKFDFGILKQCMRIGIPNAMLNGIIMLGVLILQIVTNSIGTTYIAAYSSASKIVSILTVPFYGFVTAMCVFISQNYGAGNISRAKNAVWQVMKLMLTANILVVLIAVFCSKFIIGMMVGDSSEVIALASRYTIINAIAAFSLIPIIVYKGALQAFGKPFLPTVSGFLEVAARLLVAVYFTKKFGFLGIILTDPITWFVTCLFFVITYNIEIRKIKLSDTI